MSYSRGEKTLKKIREDIDKRYNVPTSKMTVLFDSKWVKNREGNDSTRVIHWQHPANPQRMIVASVCSDGGANSYEARNFHK